MARAKKQISPRQKNHVYLKEVELRFQNKRFNSTLTDKSLTHARMVYDLFSDLQNETKEKLIVISLGLKSKVLCFEVVAIGSIDSIQQVRALEIFRTPIVMNAKGVIVVHNHPSGDPQPSSNDIKFTQKLVRVARELGLEFNDHVIIGRNRYYSFEDDAMLW